MKKLYMLTIFLFLFFPHNSLAQSLFLNMPDGNPGRRVIAEIGFENAENVKAFSLTLDISKGNILSTGPEEFNRNPDIFPALTLGGQELNFVRKGENETFHFVALTPGLPCADKFSSIGKITFDIAESAAAGSTHELTLGGQIYTATGNILDLTPVSTAFTVIPFTDKDNDGMDDTWEQYYFRSLSQSGTEDYDFDADTNLDEYLNGTDPADNIQKGDTNRDGETNLGDVIAALQVCAGITSEVCRASDVNSDRIISIEEVIYILKQIAETNGENR